MIARRSFYFILEGTYLGTAGGLVQRHGGMCEAMYTSCRDQAPVEYVRGSLLLSTDGLPQWNPSTVHTWYSSTVVLRYCKYAVCSTVVLQ